MSVCLSRNRCSVGLLITYVACSWGVHNCVKGHHWPSLCDCGHVLLCFIISLPFSSLSRFSCCPSLMASKPYVWLWKFRNKLLPSPCLLTFTIVLHYPRLFFSRLWCFVNVLNVLHVSFIFFFDIPVTVGCLLRYRLRALPSEYWGLAVGTSASYSRGHDFKSRSGHRLTGPTMVLLRSPEKCRCSILN